MFLHVFDSWGQLFLALHIAAQYNISGIPDQLSCVNPLQLQVELITSAMALVPAKSTMFFVMVGIQDDVQNVC